MEKCPLKFLIVRCLSCLNPSVLAVTSQNEISKVKFEKILEKLVSLKHMSTKDGDKVKEQFAVLIDKVVPKYRDEFDKFDMFKQRLDEFYMQYLKEKKFESLSKVFIEIFCLSHGQSDIERGFKDNKELAVTNQSEQSLIGLRLVKDHLTSNKVSSNNVQITTDMLKAVRGARAKYEEYEAQLSKKKKCSEKALKRKIISDELDEVKKKKLKLQESITELIKDADEFH